MEPFRIQPALPVQSMQTYQIQAPQSTHYRPGTCEEADCPQYINGWVSLIDESTELGQRQANYIRSHSGRRFVREPVDSNGPVKYTFEAGQKCFGSHQVRLDKPELFLVHAGDHRLNLGTVRRHVNADDWVDDFANHQDEIATRIERG